MHGEYVCLDADFWYSLKWDEMPTDDMHLIGLARMFEQRYQNENGLKEIERKRKEAAAKRLLELSIQATEESVRMEELSINNQRIETGLTKKSKEKKDTKTQKL